eukprot:126318-Pyramimonas_sp.AAC.1
MTSVRIALSWVSLGFSWGPLGLSWASDGPFWDVLGLSLGGFRGPCCRLGSPETITLNTTTNTGAPDRAMGARWRIAGLPTRGTNHRRQYIER